MGDVLGEPHHIWPALFPESQGALLQVMMCSASSRPTIASASKIIMQQGAGVKPFFAGVGPRALSNGLNSAIFFCFFEALRGVSHLTPPAQRPYTGRYQLTTSRYLEGHL